MRWLYGNTEVVAPISAPMLQIVAIPMQGETRITQPEKDRCRHLQEILLLLTLTCTGY